MTKWILLALSALALHAQADTRTRLCSGFLPENDLNIPVQDGINVLATGISESQFVSILNRIAAEYRGEVASHGAQLAIANNWADGTVNAFADRQGRRWIISMYGGLARYPRMTYDGYMAIACHEMGHHLGGAPRFSAFDWASIEGQSDYYATLKCLRRMFRNDNNEQILAGRTLNSHIVSECLSEHKARAEQLLCIRAAHAGQSLASVMAALENGKIPNVRTPDPRRVSRTEGTHPHAQCRMDTYFQGALCRVAVSKQLSRTDYRTGTCAGTAYSRGLRPRCWFKP